MSSHSLTSSSTLTTQIALTSASSSSSSINSPLSSRSSQSASGTPSSSSSTTSSVASSTSSLSSTISSEVASSTSSPALISLSLSSSSSSSSNEAVSTPSSSPTITQFTISITVSTPSSSPTGPPSCESVGPVNDGVTPLQTIATTDPNICGTTCLSTDGCLSYGVSNTQCALFSAHVSEVRAIVAPKSVRRGEIFVFYDIGCTLPDPLPSSTSEVVPGSTTESATADVTSTSMPTTPDSTPTSSTTLESSTSATPSSTPTYTPKCGLTGTYGFVSSIASSASAGGSQSDCRAFCLTNSACQSYALLNSVCYLYDRNLSSYYPTNNGMVIYDRGCPVVIPSVTPSEEVMSSTSSSVAPIIT
ncbi:hypothetical protein EJ05DRAFT_477192, partial [Pseudovirgaria hyperparasitica]